MYSICIHVQSAPFSLLSLFVSHDFYRVSLTGFPPTCYIVFPLINIRCGGGGEVFLPIFASYMHVACRCTSLSRVVEYSTRSLQARSIMYHVVFGPSVSRRQDPSASIADRISVYSDTVCEKSKNQKPKSVTKNKKMSFVIASCQMTTGTASSS